MSLKQPILDPQSLHYRSVVKALEVVIRNLLEQDLKKNCVEILQKFKKHPNPSIFKQLDLLSQKKLMECRLHIKIFRNSFQSLTEKPQFNRFKLPQDQIIQILFDIQQIIDPTDYKTSYMRALTLKKQEFNWTYQFLIQWLKAVKEQQIRNQKQLMNRRQRKNNLSQSQNPPSYSSFDFRIYANSAPNTKNQDDTKKNQKLQRQIDEITKQNPSKKLKIDAIIQPHSEKQNISAQKQVQTKLNQNTKPNQEPNQNSHNQQNNDLHKNEDRQNSDPKQDISRYLEILNKENKKTKAICSLNFSGILDELKNIHQSNDINFIHQKVNSIKIVLEKCQYLCKSLIKNVDNCQSNIKKVLSAQIKQGKEKVSKLSISQKQGKVQEQSRMYMLSKKQKITAKKQEKLLQEKLKENSQPSKQASPIQTKQAQKPSGQSIKQNMTQVCLDNNKKVKNDEKMIDENQHNLEKSPVAYLPAEEYVQKYITKNCSKTRFKKLSQDLKKNYHTINFGEDSYRLDHKNIKVDMKQFLKYDWTKVETLDLTNTGMTSNDWKTFIQSSPLFKNLKALYISKNDIRQILKDDLMKLPSLRGLQIHTSQSRNFNVLTQQSIKELKQIHFSVKSNKAILMNQYN